MAEIICHPKGTFAIQGIIGALKAQSHQKFFVDLIKTDIAHLAKNKDGSYIVKELFKHFDKQLLEEIISTFLSDLESYISDKYAVCIFKEIVHKLANDHLALSGLLKEFATYYPDLKVNTFYHFGLQEFVEVRAAHRRSSTKRKPSRRNWQACSWTS